MDFRLPSPPIIKVPSRCISASDIYRKLVTPLANWTCFFIVPRLRHRKRVGIRYFKIILRAVYFRFSSSWINQLKKQMFSVIFKEQR
ncbi:hypothetical protein DW048_12965 [Phocaeicola vulgatus]|nr:hypothetical protein DW048_12965 [Phocaeicola vulgatus]